MLLGEARNERVGGGRGRRERKEESREKREKDVMGQVEGEGGARGTSNKRDIKYGRY